MSETMVGFFYDYEYDDYSFIVGKAIDCETVVNSDGATVKVVANKFGVPCMVAFEIICAMYLLGHNVERAKNGSIVSTHALKDIKATEFALDFVRTITE